MSDPVEAILGSPRSLEAAKKLGFAKEDLRYLTKEELKVKIGNIKITSHELNKHWDDYESQRKDKISQVLNERKKFGVISRNQLSTALSNSYSTGGMSRVSKHYNSISYLPTINKEQILSQKKRKEYEMSSIMRKEMEDMEIKKVTQDKYELLLKKEKEQIEQEKLQKLKKQHETKRIHELAEFDRQQKSEYEQMQLKLQKIEIERQIEQKKLEEQKKKEEVQRKRDFEKKQKEEQFRERTKLIIQEQKLRIERKKEFLDKFAEDKHYHIQEKELEKEQQIMKKKEEKLKNIYRTIEKNQIMKEQKKQSWIDKALGYEDKKEQRNLAEYHGYKDQLKEQKKREDYRGSVLNRNLESIEEKKSRALWKLDKIEVRASYIQKRKTLRNSGSFAEEESRFMSRSSI